MLEEPRASSRQSCREFRFCARYLMTGADHGAVAHLQASGNAHLAGNLVGTEVLRAKFQRDPVGLRFVQKVDGRHRLRRMLVSDADVPAEGIAAKTKLRDVPPVVVPPERARGAQISQLRFSTQPCNFSTSRRPAHRLAFGMGRKTLRG